MYISHEQHGLFQTELFGKKKNETFVSSLCFQSLLSLLFLFFPLMLTKQDQILFLLHELILSKD